MTAHDSLLKVYGDRKYTHVTMVRHQGTTVAFAMDAARRIVYSVLDLAKQDAAKGELDAAYWADNPAELSFPREIAEVGYAIAGATAMPTVKRGGVEAGVDEQPVPGEIDPFLSTTARLTAAVPFQVISDGTYVVVLRQAIGDAHPDAVYKLTDGGCSGNTSRADFVLDGTKKVPLVRDTLLCDRFVLVEGKLKPVLEVRYRRSRHGTRPESAKDTLGTEDMDGRPFYEPTQELSFVRNLSRGRFAAVLVPTAIHGVQRWQLFAHNDATGRIDGFNVEQGGQGLFNTQGTQFYTSPDPAYRDAVFERSPGKCPFTGRDLVPVVRTDGQAETALRLNDDTSCVEVDRSKTVLEFGGKPYTIEAWIKPAAYDGPVVSRGASYQLVVAADGLVYLAHDGAQQPIKSSVTVPKDAYSHIAATFDGKTASVYVNGRLSASGAMPYVEDVGAITVIGGTAAKGRTSGHFNGDIDEVRMWNRARGAAEMTADMNHRLIGNEPGLVAYYRFDEGAGDTAHDQTDQAAHGMLKGAPQWVDSDASLGDHPGVRRDSFTLAGRKVVSGMSALLYHQQENIPAGYGAAPKPAKRQARVMLVWAAEKNGDACVASLDFGVGRDGRLGRVPEVLDPAVVKRPAKGADSERIAELQQKIKRLDADIADLDRQIAENTVTAGKVPEYQAARDRLTKERNDLQQRYDAEKGQTPSGYGVFFARLPNKNGGLQVTATNGGPPPRHVSISVAAYPWVFEDTGESQDGLPCYWVKEEHRNWYICVEGGSVQENAMLIGSQSRPANQSAHFLLRQEGEYYRLVNRKSGLAAAPDLEFASWVVQSRRGLTEDSGLLHLEPTALQSLYNQLQEAKKKLAAADDNLQQALDAQRRLTELEKVLTDKLAERDNAQNELDRLSSGVQDNDDLTVAMPLLGMDRTGLSHYGGLLDFARGADTPILLDSGTGNLVLYFRGNNGQFFAAYYDTAVTRGVQELTADGGTLSFTARDAGLELNSCTIEVSQGEVPSRCDLTITAAGESETWKSLPRQATLMAAALAGSPGEPVTVGMVATVSGTDVHLAEGATVKIPQAAHLVIGGLGCAAAAETASGVRTIKLAAPGASIKTGDMVSLVGYDFERASSSRPGVLMSSGSRLVGLVADGVEFVPDGKARAFINGNGCRWRAEMPGRAYFFDGKEQHYLSLPADKLPQAATSGDLTLEAWVNPEEGQGRIVHANTGESTYSLALAKVDLPVQSFDGNDKIELTGALDLSGRDFTIELWAKRNQARGLREPLLTHGVLTGAKDQTLHLHFNPDNTFGFHLYGDDLASPTPYPDLDWHHWAAVFVHATREQILYRDGVEIARRTATGAYAGNGPLILGHQSFSGGAYLDGHIDEVRVFGRVRTPEEIAGERKQRISDRAPGLLGHWTFGGTGAASPIKGYQVVARVGDRVLRSAERFACNEWAHVAATFKQSWALRLEGATGLAVAAQAALDVLDDLTIEVFVRIDRLGAPVDLVTKGVVLNGGPGGVPYQLSVRSDGILEFAFAEADGKAVRYTSSEAVRAGTFHRVAVVRQGRQSADAGLATEIRFYIDGRAVGSHQYTGSGAQSNSNDVEFGRGLRGELCEVRLWNAAREPQQLGLPVTERDKGLLACWAFDENAGNVSFDSRGSYPAKLRGARWTRDPDPKASPLRLYRNGQQLSDSLTTLAEDTAPYGDKQLTLGARLVAGKVLEPLTGTLEEVRVWRTMRTPEQILDNMFTRLRGAKQDLIAYWPFDRDSTAATATSVHDDGLRGNDLAFAAKRPRILLSTAPISTDTAEVRSALAAIRTPFHDTIDSAPSASEYADLQYTPSGEMTGVLKRCYGYLREGRWHLVTGYKVGDLINEWVGQVQFDPQLIGYIEGAPPVPSENLTGSDAGYAEASSVEFTEADQVTYSLSSSKTGSVNAAFNVALGLETDASVLMITAPLGVGTAQPAVDAALKVKASLGMEFSNSWSEDTQVSQGQNTTRSAQMALSGHMEDPAHLLNPAVGRRYVPANTGMALVQSETADVFALRLAHTGALVAYRMLPNPDIPKDWNIIHFPINPRYVKQGTLDGAVGFNERGKVTDLDYPTAIDYGEYSYFKPRDAYALKRRIVRDQQRLRAFYESVSTETHAPDPIQRQAQAVLRGMGVDASNDQSGREAGGSAAATGFSHRDLVNTYVWTAQGGFFAETTEATDAVTQTTSGSYSFTGTIGASVEFSVGFAGVGFGGNVDASFGGGMSSTRARSKDASRTYGLNVQCAPSSDLQKRDKDGNPSFDAAGRPVLVPGKVDAYRFFTFYLGESSANFDDFYHKVIDPVWLSNSVDANAAALRQAQQSGAKPPCWRILHRVTFISRVLPPVPPPGAPPLEKAMRTENIDSNYELIKRLEPYVRTATSESELADATRAALTAHLPELLPHADDVIALLLYYYQLTDTAPVTQSAPPAVTPPAPPTNLTTDTPTVVKGVPLTVRYSTAPDTLSSKNWVGIYPDNQPVPKPGEYFTYQYAPDADGSVTLDTNKVPVPGRYAAWYFYNDGYTTLAGPLIFTVT
ncbi:LamG-like jellyroll fold domain-containing protein [Microtetraspora fusca]|uniref:LamG-like jellyroll fold domain-containing protein n=1 Tax=Microtetraspora fusca TaxID=1997 RepID=UPI00082E93E0|nr:LamG-like jellyroll fold domain-containing protein [Microtetraspora fusca]